MPYTEEEKRTARMKEAIAVLAEEIQVKGDLNFTICELTGQLMLKTGGMGYTNVSNWIDGVHGAEAEMRRRLLNPYEDIKKKENGDVPSFVELLEQIHTTY